MLTFKSLAICGLVLCLALSASAQTRINNNQLPTNFNSSNVNGIIFVDGVTCSQADIGVGINCALAAGVAKGITIPTIWVPPGNYTYSTTPWLNSPATVRCEPGAVLNYTGSSYALEIGPNGVTDSNYDDRPYEVEGCTFTGGASMVQGIYLNYHAVKVFIEHNWFHNFGNATAYDIWSQGANWAMSVFDNYAWTDQRGPNFPYNFLYTNGANAAGTAESDGGNSQLIFVNNHIQNSSTHNSGVGVWLGGINAKVLINNITGFQPDLVFGYNSIDANVSDNYFEAFIQGATLTYPCIGYGTLTGAHTGAYTVDLILRHNYCNTHNSDFSTTSAFLGPMTGTSGLQNSAIEGNTVYNLANGTVAVVQNNLTSQVDNEAANNRISFAATNLPTVVPNGSMHTVAGNISNWLGSDGDLFYFNYTANRTDFVASARLINGPALFGYSDAGITQKFKLDAFTGAFYWANLLLSSVAPTISTHFNTSGDAIAQNGTASFTITVGTGTGTSTGALTLPTAATGWNCWLTNQTRADDIQQTGSSVTSATFTNYGTTFAATNWTNSDVLRGGCTAY